MLLQRSAVCSTVPPRAVDAPLNAAQNATGLLAYKGLPLAHVQLHVQQGPLDLSSWSVPSRYWCLGCSFPMDLGLVLAFLELHRVPVGPPRQPAKVSLEGSTAL